MNKTTLINAIMSLYDENTSLKQKLAMATLKDTSTHTPLPATLSSRFALMCYEKGLKEIVDKVEYRLDKAVEKNVGDGSYWSYEQWLNKTLDSYSNPFDTYDLRYLLKDFSINELLKELEPALRALYKKRLEIQRLNDLKESKKAEVEENN